ncbi:hypothetical protein [Streptomyces sp. RFCAC02]|uniref:hypothetical protein n=1 Tax=Streptomyces sp. RFCAC02 TaxID=2499143 RepID=UPI0010205BDA|nr:hypothetical protein [Streptomyces sp. RFCAC02]
MNGTTIGQFQDVTSFHRNLPSRPAGPNLLVANTRDDNVVHIRHSTGTVVCIPPNESWIVGGSSPLTGVRILDAPTCF